MGGGVRIRSVIRFPLFIFLLSFPASTWLCWWLEVVGLLCFSVALSLSSHVAVWRQLCSRGDFYFLDNAGILTFCKSPLKLALASRDIPGIQQIDAPQNIKNQPTLLYGHRTRGYLRKFHILGNVHTRRGFCLRREPLTGKRGGGGWRRAHQPPLSATYPFLPQPYRIVRRSETRE